MLHGAYCVLVAAYVFACVCDRRSASGAFTRGMIVVCVMLSNASLYAQPSRRFDKLRHKEKYAKPVAFMDFLTSIHSRSNFDFKILRSTRGINIRNKINSTRLNFASYEYVNAQYFGDSRSRSDVE